MRHLSDGMLRRAVDEPEAVSDIERRHVDGCPRCRAGLESARQDRDAVAGLLGAVAAGTGVRAAAGATVVGKATAAGHGPGGAGARSRTAAANGAGPAAGRRPAAAAAGLGDVDVAWAVLSARLQSDRAEFGSALTDRRSTWSGPVLAGLGGGSSRGDGAATRNTRATARSTGAATRNTRATTRSTGFIVARRGARLRRPVVIAATAAVIAIGTTAAAAAANWLPIFRPDKVTPVSFRLSNLTTLPDLAAYGRITSPPNWEPRLVANAAAAASQTGIAVPTVAALPRGVTGTPMYAVVTAGHADFTFSAAKARAAAARLGRPLPAMPAGMDGATLQVNAGPGVIESWRQQGTIPTLTVLRVTAPTATSQGVSLAVLRDYLLAQPGIPAGLAAQLRAVPADGTVLPVPVPSDLATSSTTTVNGVTATVLSLRDHSGGAVVWIRGGQLYAVFGLLNSSDLLSVARGLG